MGRFFLSFLLALSIASVWTPGNTEASAGGACMKTGCSGQLCSDQNLASTCEYRPEYACYQSAECKRQADGRCGWTETAALTACLSGGGTAAGPRISSLTPNQGPIGASITLRGSGFSTTGAGNTVQFGTHQITGIMSTDGTTLVFQIPSAMNVVCVRAPCNPVPVSPGDYPVSVVSDDRTSNGVTLTVTASGGNASACSLYTAPSSTVPAGFAVPWDIFTGGNPLLVSASCQGTGANVTVGVPGGTTTYVWHQAYTAAQGAGWGAPQELQGTKTQDGKWIVGAAALSLTSKPQYVAAYVCQFQNGGWQCGCRAQGDCGKWNIQGTK